MMKTTLFVIVLFFFSCALFRKTETTTDLATKKSLNQLESTQLVLKNVGKETQIFSYWNDSGFYQYQLIKEISQESASSQFKTENKQDSKEKLTDRKSEPVKVWVYIGGLVTLCGGLVLYKRLISSKFPRE